MARIAGINIPQNKLVHIGLTYIYGIGDKFSQQICSSLEIPRAKRVNEELGDIADAAKDVIDQAGDIGEAVKGKPRKGRKPRAKKASK